MCAGWLEAERAAALAALGVDWRPDRGVSDGAWDALLTELLGFRRAHGHVHVPPGYGRAPRLAPLLAAARAAWASGVLPAACALQLQALGVESGDAVRGGV